MLQELQSREHRCILQVRSNQGQQKGTISGASDKYPWPTVALQVTKQSERQGCQVASKTRGVQTPTPSSSSCVLQCYGKQQEAVTQLSQGDKF